MKSWITISTYFLLKYNKERKPKKGFLSARAWAPKPVYRSPTWPEYVTAFYNTVFLKKPH